MMRVGSWRDDDVPGRVAEELGLSVRARAAAHTCRQAVRARCARSTRSPRGSRRGRRGVTLIAGAEANGPARRAGVGNAARGHRAARRIPREFDGMRQAFQVGIVRALDFFPLYENALHAPARARRSRTARRSRHAMWAEMSRVAAEQPVRVVAARW